jgi:hypothetical protein
MMAGRKFITGVETKMIQQFIIKNMKKTLILPFSFLFLLGSFSIVFASDVKYASYFSRVKQQVNEHWLFPPEAAKKGL